MRGQLNEADGLGVLLWADIYPSLVNKLADGVADLSFEWPMVYARQYSCESGGYKHLISSTELKIGLYGRTRRLPGSSVKIL